MTATTDTKGTVAVRALLVLRRLQEGPATKQDLEAFLWQETGEEVNARTLRRSLEYVRRAGFEVKKREKVYSLPAVDQEMASKVSACLQSEVDQWMESLIDPYDPASQHIAALDGIALLRGMAASLRAAGVEIEEPKVHEPWRLSDTAPEEHHKDDDHEKSGA